MRNLFLVVILLCASVPSMAAIDAYTFPDEAMRDRYNELIDELRCPQCLNTNIAGSDAMIAQDLRREVHRLLIEGRSNDEILDFMHERYGDFILYKPRLQAGTLVLWFAPLLLALIAALLVFRIGRGSQSKNPVLDEAEQSRLKKLLSEKS